jgi:hypothetical protein
VRKVTGWGERPLSPPPRWVKRTFSSPLAQLGEGGGRLCCGGWKPPFRGLLIGQVRWREWFPDWNAEHSQFLVQCGLIAHGITMRASYSYNHKCRLLIAKIEKCGLMASAGPKVCGLVACGPFSVYRSCLGQVFNFKLGHRRL